MRRRQFLQAAAALGSAAACGVAQAAPACAEADALWASIDALSAAPLAQRSAEAIVLAERIAALPEAEQRQPRIQDAYFVLCEWMGEALLSARASLARLADGAALDEAAVQEGIAAVAAVETRAFSGRRAGRALARQLRPERRRRYARRALRQIDAMIAESERIYARGERRGSERVFGVAMLGPGGAARGPMRRRPVSPKGILGNMLVMVLLGVGALLILFGLVEAAGNAGGTNALLNAGLLLCVLALVIGAVVKQRRQDTAREVLRLSAAGALPGR